MIYSDPFGNEIDPVTGLPMDEAQRLQAYLAMPQAAETYGLSPQSKGVPAEAIPQRNTWMDELSAQLFPPPNVLPPDQLISPEAKAESARLLGIQQPAPAAAPVGTGLLNDPGIQRGQSFGLGATPDEEQTAPAGQSTMPAMPGVPSMGQAPGMGGVLRQENAAVDMQTRASQEENRVRGAHTEQVAGELQSMRTADALVAQREREIGEETLKSAEKSYNDVISASQTKLDPGRWWKNRSTGGRIASGISVALGAIGQAALIAAGNTGAKNVGLDIIEKVIDQDLALQEDDRTGAVRAAQAGLQKATTLSNITRQNFQDVRAAAAQDRALGFKLAELQLDKSLVGVTDKKILANAATLKAAIAEKGQKAAADAHEKERNFRLKLHSEQRTDLLAGAQIGNLIADNETARIKARQGPEGSWTPFGSARNKEAANDVVNFEMNFRGIQRDLGDLRGIRTRAGAGGEKLDRDLVSEGAAVAARIKYKLGQAAGLKQLTTEETKAMEQVIGGSPTNFIYNLGILDNLEKRLEQQREDVRSLNLLPGQESQGNDREQRRSAVEAGFKPTGSR